MRGRGGGAAGGERGEGVMCQEFSCLFIKNGEVLWKFGTDSHEDLIRAAKLKDDGREQTFVRVEITPRNKSYLRPDAWTYRVDQDDRPEWYRAEFAEAECRKAHAEWLKKLRAILPEQDIIDPFGVPPPNEITPAHLALLREWASVRATVVDSDSVWDSVWASVRGSVGASGWASVRATVVDSVWASVRGLVGNSVGASVRATVVDSVWGSIWAYAGSLFRLPRSAWKYAEHIPGDGYPFQPAVDLWHQGLVPSYDGMTWRLHGGPDGRVLWEGKI